MGIKKVEVKCFHVEYLCDVCGQPMKRTGNAYMCNPPKYPHTCVNGHEEILDECYPGLTYEHVVATE